MKRHRIFTVQDILNSACGDLNRHLLEEKPAKKSKRAKFNNEKVEYDGEMFDSRKEYKRWRELLLLQKAGVITQLRRQIKFELIKPSKTERACNYVADHVYMDCATGEKIVEDVKSEATRKLSTYIMKRKLMKEVHGITIREY